MLAQREHDGLADAGEAADHRRREHPRGRVDAQVDDHVAQQASRVALLHPVVDRVLHEQQADHRAGRAEQRDHAEECDALVLAVQVAGRGG